MRVKIRASERASTSTREKKKKWKRKRETCDKLAFRWLIHRHTYNYVYISNSRSLQKEENRKQRVREESGVCGKFPTCQMIARSYLQFAFVSLTEIIKRVLGQWKREKKHRIWHEHTKKNWIGAKNLCYDTCLKIHLFDILRLYKQLWCLAPFFVLYYYCCDGVFFSLSPFA